MTAYLKAMEICDVAKESLNEEDLIQLESLVSKALEKVWEERDLE